MAYALCRNVFKQNKNNVNEQCFIPDMIYVNPRLLYNMCMLHAA